MHHFNLAPSNYSNGYQGMRRADRTDRVDCQAPARPTFKSTMNPDGSNTTETDGYIFTTRPGNSETGGTFTIFNKKTGKEQEHIWGDPHSSGGEFRGTLTMLLDDGIKASVETTKYKNTNSTLASRITLSNDHEAIQLSGVSSGALTATRGDGRRLDRSVADGMTVYSTPDGMRGEHGEVVNQQYMNARDTQLNPWLQGKPDTAWHEFSDSHENNGFSNGFRSTHITPRVEAEIHRHLQNFMRRLQHALGINSMQMAGQFSGMTHVPPQMYSYQNSLGWSLPYNDNPFMQIQAK